jgi:hypothetical protein
MSVPAEVVHDLKLIAEVLGRPHQLQIDAHIVANRRTSSYLEIPCYYQETTRHKSKAHVFFVYQTFGNLLFAREKKSLSSLSLSFFLCCLSLEV